MPTPHKLDKQKALVKQMAIAGATHETIAKATGCARESVSRALKRFGLTTQNIIDYRENRADVLAGLQAKILASVTTADLRKANLRDKVISAGVLYDKERLETGASTSNVHILSRVIGDAWAD